MRKMHFIDSALVAICLLLAGPLASGQGAKGSSNVEQQISKLTDQIVQAILKGDTSLYEKYYADDAFVIHSAGTLSTKAQEISDLKSGALKYESYSVREKKIHVYGDTAVVNLLSSAKGVIHGKPFDSDFCTTRVWVKQNGNWKVVLFQATRVAPPSQ